MDNIAKDIPKIITMATEMIEKEQLIDPFLPEMPEMFLQNNITSILMKLGIGDVNGNLSLVNMKIEEVASEVFKEAIERLYKSEDEQDMECEKNTKDMDKAVKIEVQEIAKTEVTYLKSTTGYIHPERRYQPPMDIRNTVLLTTNLLKEEKHKNPFLPKVPNQFFAKYLDGMLKKIDYSLFKNRCPRLRKLKTEEVASKLLDEAIEKLYDIDQEKENKEIENTVIEFEDIMLEEDVEEVKHEDKSNNECEAKKKKWSLRRFLKYLIPCINKKDN